MPIPENQYNLIDENWIRVRISGERDRYDYVGLDELFHRAAEIADIDTGNPISDLAVLRLALSIAHSAMVNEVIQAHGLEDTDMAFSVIRDQLFGDYQLFYDRVNDYLQIHHEQFWLLGQNRFGQDLAGDEDAIITSEKLDGIANRALRGFGTDLDKPPATFDVVPFGDMPFAEAALCVVSMQSFNTGGKRFLGAAPKESKNNGAAYGGLFAHIGVKGIHLDRTLLMNLSLESIHPNDKPVWEYASTCDYYPWRPTGYISATAPNSRVIILAERQGHIVASVVRHRESLTKYGEDKLDVTLDLCSGIKVADGGIHGKAGGYPIGNDPFMATFDYGRNRKTVKFAGTEPGRFLRRSWLDYLGELTPEISTIPELEAMLEQDDQSAKGTQLRQNLKKQISMRPLSVELTRRLLRAGYVSKQEPVRIFAAGIEFSDGFYSKIIEQHYDELLLPVWLFDQDHDVIRQFLIEAYLSCEEVISRGIYQFAKHLAYAKGFSTDAVKPLANRLCSAARHEFDRILAEHVASLALDGADDYEIGISCHDNILDEVRAALIRIINDELQKCGRAEVVGHTISDVCYTAASARTVFYNALNKWMVYAGEDADEEYAMREDTY